MKAMTAGGLPDKPMWKVEGPTNYYLVFDGRQLDQASPTAHLN